MKKILTIISEYNPFHFGHEYQLSESIKMMDDCYKVCIMSGNFVQRGEPSFINKWSRAKVALDGGFDLVIELPTVYAISSAENFARGAIKIADVIGSDYLSFGSENGNIETLKELTSLIDDDYDRYIDLVKEKIQEGFSYPKSQEIVINELFGGKFDGICSSNNILGFEYLKSISALNSSIEPITIKRNLDMNSSSNIRGILRSNINLPLDELYKILPKYSADVLFDNIKNGKVVSSLRCFEKEIFYLLRRMSDTDIANIPDVPGNMLTNLKKVSYSTNNLDELILGLKNKSVTQARIQRILLYVLLGITQNDIDISKRITPYVRILGMNENGKEIISSISKKCSIVSSVKNFENNNNDFDLKRLLDIDKFASDVYSLSFEKDSKGNLDYTTRIVTL